MGNKWLTLSLVISATQTSVIMLLNPECLRLGCPVQYVYVYMPRLTSVQYVVLYQFCN